VPHKAGRATPPRLQQTKVEGDHRVHEGRVHAARRLWASSDRALDCDNNGGTAQSSNVTAIASEMDAAELWCQWWVFGGQRGRFGECGIFGQVNGTAIDREWNHSEHLRLGCARWGSTGAILELLIMCFYRTVLLPGRSVQQHLDGFMRPNRLCRRVREEVCVIRCCT
jgi:hypothetical protein